MEFKIEVLTTHSKIISLNADYLDDIEKQMHLILATNTAHRDYGKIKEIGYELIDRDLITKNEI